MFPRFWKSILENTYLIYITIITDDYELPRANISRVNVTVDDPPQTGGLTAADLKDDRMFSVRDTYRYRAQVGSNYCTKSNIMYQFRGAFIFIMMYIPILDHG